MNTNDFFAIKFHDPVDTERFNRHLNRRWKTDADKSFMTSLPWKILRAIPGHLPAKDVFWVGPKDTGYLSLQQYVQRYGARYTVVSETKKTDNNIWLLAAGAAILFFLMK